MDGTTEQSFRERLDEYYDWPCHYLFKFIAPQHLLDEVTALFGDDTEISTRESRKGNYVSVTAEVEMGGSEEVIEVYRQAAEIGGVMPL